MGTQVPQHWRSKVKICYSARFGGGVPEWLKGADCKSVGLRLRWFESSLLHHRKDVTLGDLRL